MSALLDLFYKYGYYVTFIFLFLENVLFLGLILPGDTILVLSGFLAAFNHFKIIYVIPLAAVASILGNIAGYIIGQRGGRPLIERFTGRFPILQDHLSRAESYFETYGASTVFFGRFITGVRVFISPLAGASKMSYPKFFLYTVFAVITWTVSIVLLGYFFGENWSFLVKVLKGFGWLLLFLAVLVIFFVILLKRPRRMD